MARIQRQELKHDEFVDSMEQFRVYLEEHGRRLGLLALLVILGAVAIGGYLWNAREQEKQASIMLTGAIQTFNGQVQAGLPPLPGQESTVFSSEEAKWAAAVEKFSELHAKYPDTHAGLVARHYEGISRYRAGEMAEAVTILEEVARSSNWDAAALAKLHLAAMYLEVGRGDEAEKLYRELVERPAVTVPKAIAQMDLAALLSSDRPAEARELYEEIQSGSPDNPLAGTAGQRLEMLPAADPDPETAPEPKADPAAAE